MAKKLLLLDGSALLYRSFFALMRTPLSNSAGLPTGALLGFVNTALMFARAEKPDYFAVVFDAPGKGFRHEIYPEYKANRAKTPDELREQMPWARRLVEAWPAVLLVEEGVEADDVIGSFARQLAGPDLEVLMVTGDKDFYQLLGPHVSLLNPGRGGTTPVDPKHVGPEGVAEKFGVTDPAQVVDVLALMGDTSDNVPGVPGIGPKTAGKLISEYGDLDGLYAHVDEIPAKKARENLVAHEADARRARELVTIRTDLPLPALDTLVYREPGGEAWLDVLRELEFRNLVKEFAPEGEAASVSAEAEERYAGYRLVDTEAGLEELARRLAKAEVFALDTETTGIDALRVDLVGVSVATAEGEGDYVNVGHAAGNPLGVETVRRVLGPVLADPAVHKTGHNLKYDLLVLGRAGIEVEGVTHDSMIASYLLDPERSHKLDNLVRDRFGVSMIPITELIGTGKNQVTMREVDPDTAARYAAEDADMALRLMHAQLPELDESGTAGLFRDVEMPLSRVLTGMERVGVKVDTAFLGEMSERLEEELARLETECRELADTDFNLNSPQQLADVLFVRLGLPTGKKTKTGWSTDSEVLEKLAPHHDLPGRILEYRQVAKLKSTYVDALPRLVNPETGRIHASFNQAVAATGRLSSSDPNLQNIPVRTELGREVRRAFVPGEPGWLLLSADYSQIELRIMAHLSGDPVLVHAFREGIDVHRDTAARIFGVDPDDVSDLQRGQAKTVNFGILYGQGAFGLARTLGIPNAEASTFLREYKEIYAGVIEYLESTLEGARERGYVTTLLGRRRYLPNLKARGGPARAAAERLAVNTPIQGSAADMIKVAMVQLDRRLREEKRRSRMIAQVHDELLLEVPEEEADEVGELVRTVMVEAVELTVPVVVNVGIGGTWAEIH